MRAICSLGFGEDAHWRVTSVVYLDSVLTVNKVLHNSVTSLLGSAAFDIHGLGCISELVNKRHVLQVRLRSEAWLHWATD